MVRVVTYNNGVLIDDNGELEPLHDLQSRTLSDLAARRWQATQRMTYDGVEINPDSTSKVVADRLFAFSVLRGSGSPFPQTTNWDLAKGAYRVYAESDLIALGLACMTYIQSCFDHAKTLTEQIEAAQTPEELAAIDIESGWPQ